MATQKKVKRRGVKRSVASSKGNRGKDKKWMQKAVKHPGSFRKYCGGKVTKECIERGKRSKDPTIRRRAVLAETFAKHRKKGKSRKK